jgi:hypothetical protein
VIDESVAGGDVHAWLVAASNTFGLHATRVTLAPSATDVLFEITPLWRATYPKARNVTVTVTPVVADELGLSNVLRVDAAAYEVFYPMHWRPAVEERVQPVSAQGPEVPIHAVRGFSLL